MNFLYPLKPTRISIDSSILNNSESDPNFILQIKKNGWRTQIHKNGNEIEFFTRHNKRLEPIAADADWKLLTELIVNNIKAESAIIDGEFLHRRGTRKSTLYVWDLFLLNNELQKKPYGNRKCLLNSIVVPHNNLIIAHDHVDNFLKVWDTLDEVEDEGIVIKDLREQLYISFDKTVKSARQFKILAEDKRNHVSIQKASS